MCSSTKRIIFIFSALAEGRVLHPVQKPLGLGSYLVRTYSEPEDIILDNACGAGIFLVAAILEGRRFIGIENIESPQQFKSL